MKKFMAMLLALVMALSLVACGQKADDTKKDDAADTDDSLVVLENVVDWGETEPYRVLVQKGDPKGLLEGINKAIAELTANDGALIKEIEDKVASQDTYMPDAVSSDLAAETTDDTAASDKPVLVMGTSPDYPPYEFFADAAMTEYAGIDVEVAKYIAESMGMTLQIESMNFDNLVPYIAKVAVGKLEKVHVFGNDYPTPDGTGVRDYIHVVDLARGHVAAIKKLEEKPGLFICNLGTGHGYSVLDVIHAFSKACGKELPYVIDPRRPGDIAECWCDPSKAKRELGWEAQYGIEEMCAHSWNWQSHNPDGYKTAK